MPILFRLIFAVVLTAPSLTWARECSGLYLKGKHEIHLELAKNAGLHYITKDSPGYYRHSKGRGENETFYYTDSKGKTVTNPTILKRIENLGIPPGYTDVWIAADPKGHLQAYGKDAKERPQYRYHEIWKTEVLAVSKFERMEQFGHALAGLREVVAEHLDKKQIDLDSQTQRRSELSKRLESALAAKNTLKKTALMERLRLKKDMCKFVEMRFSLVLSAKKGFLTRSQSEMRVSPGF